MTRPALVVLTGGIASGKTAVSDRFTALGVPVIDTDVLAREVVAPGSEGLAEVAKVFGQQALDDQGRLDRAWMRSHVFSDDKARRRLESILHPRIADRARQAIAEHRDAVYVLLVVPLLVESGLFADADRVLVVDVPESVQIQRLMARDGADADQARAMLNAQTSRQQRLAVADEVIDNSGDLAALDARVADLHRQFVGEFFSR